MCKIWRDENMPDDWKVAWIVVFFKKGDKMKCENYRGITLLNVECKILSSITLEGLKEYSEETLGEYQCGMKNFGYFIETFKLWKCSKEIWLI
jgi:hypothetical protein